MNAKQEWLRLLAGVLAITAACGFNESMAGASSRARVHVSSFSVAKPHGVGWQTSVDKRNQMITFRNQTGPKAEIKIFRNTVTPRDPRALNVDEIADDFREHEKDIMWLYGEMPGQYKLENVKQGEVNIGDRKFYYMTFRQVMNEEKLGYPLNVDEVMYLHFLQSFPKLALFYVFVFKEFYIRETEEPTLQREQIQNLLASFHPKQK